MTGKEYLCFCGEVLLRQIHERAAGVDQRDARADAGEGHRGALVDFNLQAVGHEAHHAGRFDPGNLLELRFLLRQRNKENVAANIGAHHFHDLRFGHVLHARDFNVVARLHAKAPGVLAVLIQGGGNNCGDAQNGCGNRSPEEAAGSFFRKRTAAGRDTLLPAQKWRFLVRIQVDQARIVEILAWRLVPRVDGAGRVQLFLRDGGTAFSRHQFRSVVVEESLSFFNIAAFLELR